MMKLKSFKTKFFLHIFLHFSTFRSVTFKATCTSKPHIVPSHILLTSSPPFLKWYLLQFSFPLSFCSTCLVLSIPVMISFTLQILHFPFSVLLPQQFISPNSLLLISETFYPSLLSNCIVLGKVCLPRQMLQDMLLFYMKNLLLDLCALLCEIDIKYWGFIILTTLC